MAEGKRPYQTTSKHLTKHTVNLELSTYAILRLLMQRRLARGEKAVPINLEEQTFARLMLMAVAGIGIVNVKTTQSGRRGNGHTN